MKRFAPLALIVLALAVAPAAFADGGGAQQQPQQQPQQQAQQAGHPIARLHVEILRLRLQLVHLRYRIACHDRSSDRCTQFAQKVVDRLTTLDGDVQQKLADLKCASDSTDAKCALLAKLDSRLQSVISKLGSPSSTSESAVDQAAGNLGKLAGPPQP